MRSLVLALLFASGAVSAQPDTLRLSDVRAAAAEADPRGAQPELLARASRLRLEALRAGRLPRLALIGQGTLQSDVPSIPLSLPDGSSPAPPKEQVRAHVEADWSLYDGGRTALHSDLERARLAEQTAGVAVALYGLREAATESFFGALLLGAQAETLALAAQDLDAQVALLRRRAAEGAVLASEAAGAEAEWIRVRQRQAEAEADRRVALAVLADLTGLAIPPEAPLALPDLDALVALTLDAGAVVGDEDVADGLELTDRPEFERFARTRERAEAEARLAASATRPGVSLFGQAGVGRPSPFDFLSDELKPYALVGVRLRWAPVDWGRSQREAGAARLQATIAQTEADALARQLRRSAEADLADVERLSATGADDARVIALREEILRVARRQLKEGVLLAPAYVDVLTDLAEARLVAARHRIELARAQARLLSTFGLFPDEDPRTRPLDRSMRSSLSAALARGTLLLALPLAACGADDEADAYGNIEATETVVSAEADGRLLAFTAQEGDILAAGEVVGLVDTTQLSAQRDGLLAQRRQLLGQQRSLLAQARASLASRDAALEAGDATFAGVAEAQAGADAVAAQLQTAREEAARTQRLYADDAATARELNERQGQVAVLEEQVRQARARAASIRAQAGDLGLAGPRAGRPGRRPRGAGRRHRGPDRRDRRPTRRPSHDRIANAFVEAPVGGTVLTVVAEPGETVRTGSPLFTLADLSSVTLRAYASGNQLAQIRLGMPVEVRVDDGSGGLRTFRGEITAIASEAQFTPTPIQTRDERAELVYAFDVRLTNPEGFLKVGMPGEVRFPVVRQRPDASGDR